jgi:hypothetical protein
MTMNTHRDIKLYNILLPLWLLIFFPSYLWFFLIPANYLLDRIVLKWGLGDMEDKGRFCRRHTYKICLAGFLSDLAGVIVLLGVSVPLASIDEIETFLEAVSYGIMFNPFSNILSLIVVAVAVALSGLCIYKLDQVILKKAGVDPERTRKAALKLALFTAPYVYFFPTGILYESGTAIL